MGRTARDRDDPALREVWQFQFRSYSRPVPRGMPAELELAYPSSESNCSDGRCGRFEAKSSSRDLLDPSSLQQPALADVLNNQAHSILQCFFKKLLRRNNSAAVLRPYSTVTLFAKFLGLSTSVPRSTAA